MRRCSTHGLGRCSSRNGPRCGCRRRLTARSARRWPRVVRGRRRECMRAFSRCRGGDGDRRGPVRCQGGRCCGGSGERRSAGCGCGARTVGRIGRVRGADDAHVARLVAGADPCAHRDRRPVNGGASSPPAHLGRGRAGPGLHRAHRPGSCRPASQQHNVHPMTQSAPSGRSLAGRPDHPLLDRAIVHRPTSGDSSKPVATVPARAPPAPRRTWAAVLGRRPAVPGTGRQTP